MLQGIETTIDGSHVQRANDIADWLVRYSADDLGAPVDPMSLEKLVYYAQAFHLALSDEPLFSDEIQAWKWGPVVPSVYKRYAGYGSDPIITLVDGEAVHVGERVEHFLADLVGFFGRNTAINLSRATHLESPWIEASKRQDTTISQYEMKEFYSSLIEEGENALSRQELLDTLSEPRWAWLYTAGICWRKMTDHPFYDGTLAKQLSNSSEQRVRDLPKDFFAPVKGRDFIEFRSDEDIDETIRKALS